MDLWKFYHRQFPPLLLLLLLISLPRVLPQDHIEVSAVVGNTGILPCEVDDIGTQQVIWRDPPGSILTINQQTVTDDDRISVNRPYVKEWNLHIENIKKSDQGTYSCIINSSPQKTKSVTLWVWYPPTITDTSHDREVEVRPGEGIVLSCEATGFPEPKINWYKYNYNGEKEELLLDSSTLRFSNISREDGGDYECVAVNDVSPSDKHAIKLDVKFPPEVTLPYQQITQHPGKDTLLECMISANPLVTHHWERNGVIVKESDKYKLNEWDVGEYSKTLSLHVKELKGEDFGAYTCVAANEFGTVVENMFVYAYQAGQIRVLEFPRDVISHGSQSVHFNCSVEGVSATNSLTWWHHHPTTGYTKLFQSHPAGGSGSASGFHGGTSGGSINSRSKYEIKGFYNLYINNVAMQDSGEYICQISGHRNYSASLTYVESPICDSSGSVDAMRTASVSCSLAFGGPRPTWEVTWQHGDRKLSGINSDTSGSLSRQLSFIALGKDQGVYTCSISSQDPPYSSQCSANLYVKAGDGSALPSCTEAEGSYDNTLLLAILGAAICGLIILFLCILVAVIVNFKRQIKKYHNGPRSVRYKNGNVSVETEGLTREGGGGLPDEVEV